jgi:hypothetical protein
MPINQIPKGPAQTNERPTATTVQISQSKVSRRTRSPLTAKQKYDAVEWLKNRRLADKIAGIGRFEVRVKNEDIPALRAILARSGLLVPDPRKLRKKTSADDKCSRTYDTPSDLSTGSLTSSSDAKDPGSRPPLALPVLAKHSNSQQAVWDFVK